MIWISSEGYTLFFFKKSFEAAYIESDVNVEDGVLICCACILWNLEQPVYGN